LRKGTACRFEKKREYKFTSNEARDSWSASEAIYEFKEVS